MQNTVKSMTGYGRFERYFNSRRFLVEIRTVNHKYNEQSIKLPRIFNCFEDLIRKKLSLISRGKIEVFVTLESVSGDDFAVKINDGLLNAYYEKLRGIQSTFQLQDEPTLSLLTELPDVFVVEKTVNTEDIWPELSLAIDEALKACLQMRDIEGAALKESLLEKLANCKSLIESIQALSPLVAKQYMEKLTERLQKQMQEVQIELDESRLCGELLLFADKSCIDEELTRLQSHIKQFEAALEVGSPIGRKLDFLAQEFFREVNTISSKANHLEITKLTVDLKSEIEKIREQAANIE